QNSSSTQPCNASADAHADDDRKPGGKIAMRSLLLIFSILSSPAIAQVTLEDWACYQVTNATSAGAGKSNLTCNAPHGWGAPGAVVYLNIEGATGTWSQINNQSWLNSNPMSIGATDTKIQMNETRWLMGPGM